MLPWTKISYSLTIMDALELKSSELIHLDVQPRNAPPVSVIGVPEDTMFYIADEMRSSHSADILPRDLKSSKILCTRGDIHNRSEFPMIVTVADYESSV